MTRTTTVPAVLSSNSTSVAATTLGWTPCPCWSANANLDLGPSGLARSSRRILSRRGDGQRVGQLAGRAISGELAGTALEQIHDLDTVWFAWSTYQPETDLVDE